MASWWRARPRASAALGLANRLLKYLCYLLYPLLLVLAACEGLELFARLFLVPLVGFAAVTLLRRIVDEPRPYEAFGTEGALHKDTRGKSFPSRHIFSIFAIAMSWLYVSAPMGAALLVLGCVLALIRVVGGVHYPRDVVAGALIGIAFGLVGYWGIPW